MALKKTIPTRFGMQAEYWKIMTIVLEANSMLRVCAALFLNEEARRSGGNPVDICQEDFNITLDDFIGFNPTQVGYACLKRSDKFIDSIDV
jgi:hypothetical protein